MSRYGQATSVASYYLGTAVGRPLTKQCGCGRFMVDWMERCWDCERMKKSGGHDVSDMD